MPRRRQRFSDLDQLLRELGTGTPGAGTRLAGYLDFRKGIRRISIPAANRPAAGDKIRKGVSIIPFNKKLAGATATAGELYVAGVSKNSADARAASGLNDAELGWAAVLPAHQQDPSFFSALFKWGILRVSSPGATPVSQITGKQYSRPRTLRNFQVPFGRSVADQTQLEEDRRKFLANEAKTASGAGAALVVGYEPEQFAGGNALPSLL